MNVCMCKYVCACLSPTSAMDKDAVMLMLGDADDD